MLIIIMTMDSWAGQQNGSPYLALLHPQSGIRNRSLENPSPGVLPVLRRVADSRRVRHTADRASLLVSPEGTELVLDHILGLPLAGAAPADTAVGATVGARASDFLSQSLRKR